MDSAARHTPGPWREQPLAGHHDYAVYAEADGKDVALVRDFHAANARLIAAAPDLYAALRAIANVWPTKTHPAMVAARAALARVDGATADGAA